MVSSVLSKLADEGVAPEALENVANAIIKIHTLDHFREFLDYIEKMEEYSVIHQYLYDQLDIIVTNLEDIQTAKEDQEDRGGYERIDPTNPDVRHDPREVDHDMPLDVDDRFDPSEEIDTEDAECSYRDEEIDTEKSDLD